MSVAPTFLCVSISFFFSPGSEDFRALPTMQYSHPDLKPGTFSQKKKKKVKTKLRDFKFFFKYSSNFRCQSDTLFCFEVLFSNVCVNLLYIVGRYMHLLHMKPQGGCHQFSVNEIVQHFPLHKSVLVYTTLSDWLKMLC